MHIWSNGSKWLGEAPDSVDVLIAALGRYTLDPTFERYGNFCIYSPTDERPYRVWGNFADVSHVFQIDGTLEELGPLLKAIKANKRTPRYCKLAASMGLR